MKKAMSDATEMAARMGTAKITGVPTTPEKMSLKKVVGSTVTALSSVCDDDDVDAKNDTVSEDEDVVAREDWTIGGSRNDDGGARAFWSAVAPVTIAGAFDSDGVTTNASIKLQQRQFRKK